MIEEIIEYMGVDDKFKKSQKMQTAHRLKLISFWKIEVGSKVLEIGCGQGGMTAALAYIVGGDGFVHGIDALSAEYGSPVTFGESCNKLSHSSLGRHIQIDFSTDVLSDEVHFSPDYFDYIIFSHCSWYFESADTLLKVMKKIKVWGKKLCFAEWDIRVNKAEQMAHYNAVLIKAQCECFHEESISNVRTLFTPTQLKGIAAAAGWNIIDETSIYSDYLQDGTEEVETVLRRYPNRVKSSANLPVKLKTLILSQLELLNNLKEHFMIKPLSVYAFAADRK